MVVEILVLLNGIACSEVVTELGHRDWRVREKAQYALRCVGELAEPALQRAVTIGDREVQGRAKQLLSRLYWLPQLQLKRLLSTPEELPWLNIDGGTDGYITEEVQTYLIKAESAGYTREWPDYSAWRYATKLWINDRMVSGMTTITVLARIREMRHQDTMFLTGN